MRNLVPLVQFKKREKHPWRSGNFSKVAGFNPATLLKLTLLHVSFSRFLNCTNGTKSRNAPQMYSTSCAISHHEVKIYKVDEMVQSIKYQISQERNMTFP